VSAYQLFHNEVNTKGGDYISVTKDYQVNFPVAFFMGNGLIGKKAVLLYFDPKSDKAAFVFVEQKVPKSFLIGLATNGKRQNGHIGPKSFFKRNGLMGNIRTGRYDYDVTEIDGQKAFEIKLERLKQESKP